MAKERKTCEIFYVKEKAFIMGMQNPSGSFLKAVQKGPDKVEKYLQEEGQFVIRKPERAK